jgi:hypothetical protein
VQVSQATRELADAAVADAADGGFVWRQRGEVAVKGKGRMSTFMLRCTPSGVVPPDDADASDDEEALAGNSLHDGSAGSAAVAAAIAARRAAAEEGEGMVGRLQL